MAAEILRDPDKDGRKGRGDAGIQSQHGQRAVTLVQAKVYRGRLSDDRPSQQESEWAISGVFTAVEQKASGMEQGGSGSVSEDVLRYEDGLGRCVI